MRIVCAYSGLPFSCDHFPATLSDRESYHPIFDIPQKRLFQYAIKWANRELTDTDKYLLYLALFNSTEQIDWRTNARWTVGITKTIEQNMEALLRIVGKINLVRHPNFVISRIAITPDTRDLTNSPHWIHIWEQGYEDFTTGYKDAALHDKIAAREQLITKLIKDTNKPIDAYARILADWAEMASAFPSYDVTIEGRKLPINEYWKQIIVACCKEEKIFLIPKLHIEKLLEYLEENLDGGSSAAFTVFRLIRDGLKKQHNYLGLGAFDLGDTPSFSILRGTETVEDVNKMMMINSAPDSLPTQAQYPNWISYCRAKAKWDMKQAYIEQQVAIKKLNDELLAGAENDPVEMDEQDEDDSIIDEDELRKSGGFDIDPIGGEL